MSTDDKKSVRQTYAKLKKQEDEGTLPPSRMKTLKAYREALGIKPEVPAEETAPEPVEPSPEPEAAPVEETPVAEKPKKPAPKKDKAKTADKPKETPDEETKEDK